MLGHIVNFEITQVAGHCRRDIMSNHHVSRTPFLRDKGTAAVLTFYSIFDMTSLHRIQMYLNIQIFPQGMSINYT